MDKYLPLGGLDGDVPQALTEQDMRWALDRLYRHTRTLGRTLFGQLIYKGGKVAVGGRVKYPLIQTPLVVDLQSMMPLYVQRLAYGRDPSRDWESPFHGINLPLYGETFMSKYTSYPIHQDLLNGHRASFLDFAFDNAYARHSLSLKESGSSPFEFLTFADAAQNPIVVRGGFHLASDVVETMPAAYDGQTWSPAHKMFIPGALTSIATLKKHSLLHRDGITPDGVGATPVDKFTLVDALTHEALTMYNLPEDRRKKARTLADCVDFVYDKSRGTGVGAWMIAPSATALGSSSWKVTEDPWSLIGTHVHGAGEPRLMAEFQAGMANTLDCTCLACFKAYEEAVKNGDPIPRLCDYSDLPTGNPCFRCQGNQVCKQIDVVTYSQDNDPLFRRVSASLRPSILPMIDRFHLAKSLPRSFRNWWISCGSSWLDSSPVNYLCHLSAIWSGTGPAVLSKSLKKSMRPYTLHVADMMSQRAVTNHCSDNTRAIVKSAGLAIVPFAPAHSALISAKPTGVASLLAGCSPLMWSSSLGGSLWSSMTKSSLLIGATPTSKEGARSSRALPVVNEENVADARPNIEPPAPPPPPPPRSVPLQAAVEVGSDRVMGLNIGITNNGDVVRLVRVGPPSKEIVEVNEAPIIPSFCIKSILTNPLQNTPYNCPPPNWLPLLKEQRKLKVVEMVVGHSGLARCLFDLFILTDNGLVLASPIHNHPPRLDAHLDYPELAPTPWSPVEATDCPLNCHHLLYTPYDTSGCAIERGRAGHAQGHFKDWREGNVRMFGVSLVASQVNFIATAAARDEGALGYSLVLGRREGTFAVCPEAELFPHRPALSHVNPVEVLKPNLRLFLDDESEPVPVSQGLRVPRGNGQAPEAALGGGYVAGSVTTPRIDSLGGGAGKPYTPTWLPILIDGLQEGARVSMVTLSSFVQSMVAVFDVTSIEQGAHVETLIAAHHWPSQRWHRLTKPPDPGQLNVHDGLFFGLAAHLTLQGPLLPLSHLTDGHGVRLVKMGGAVGLLLCSCSTCSIAGAAGWRAAWSKEAIERGTSLPTLLLLSRPGPVIATMEVLHEFLAAHGHTGPASRAPKDPAASIGQITASIGRVLRMIRPSPDPWGSKWRLNGNHAHLSRDLERGLKVNMATHESWRPLGQRLGAGYSRAVITAFGVNNVTWTDSEDQELRRQRAHVPEHMVPETLPVEGLFGIASKRGDHRYARGTVTETMKGIQKAGLRSHVRQQIALRALKVILKKTRDGEEARMPIRSFLNDPRAKSKSRQRTAYLQRPQMEPDQVGLPLPADLLPVRLDKVPCLPALGLLDDRARERFVIAEPAEEAQPQPDLMAAGLEDDVSDDDDGPEEDVNNPEEDVDDDEVDSEPDDDGRRAPHHNDIRHDDERRLFMKARNLMNGRLISGRLAAQPVASRSSRKTNPQHGSSHQHAHGGRAQEGDRVLDADHQASLCT